MKNAIRNVRSIIYVADQNASRDFYRRVFAIEPVLDVPGMTEFEIGPETRFGIMPEKGIAKIICPAMADPASASGIPRCEIYLEVDGIAEFTDRARAAGAVEVSPLSERDWGHRAIYFADPDGHILAFAELI